MMLTLQDFADAFNVSVRTVQRWIADGVVREDEVSRPRGRGKGKPVRIAQSALVRLSAGELTQRTTPGVNAALNARLKKRLGV